MEITNIEITESESRWVLEAMKEIAANNGLIEKITSSDGELRVCFRTERGDYMSHAIIRNIRASLKEIAEAIEKHSKTTIKK